MLWETDWTWGIVTLALCIIFHVTGLVALRRLVIFPLVSSLRAKSAIFSISVFSFLAISAVLFHATEAAIWAVMYVRLNVLTDFAHAYLHSLGAFSTYGNSGYDLNMKWRLLSQIEAMNGIVAFGLTTAFLYAAAHLIHQNSEETEMDFLKTGK